MSHPFTRLDCDFTPGFNRSKLRAERIDNSADSQNSKGDDECPEVVADFDHMDLPFMDIGIGWSVLTYLVSGTFTMIGMDFLAAIAAIICAMMVRNMSWPSRRPGRARALDW